MIPARPQAPTQRPIMPHMMVPPHAMTTTQQMPPQQSHITHSQPSVPSSSSHQTLQHFPPNMHQPNNHTGYPPPSIPVTTATKTNGDVGVIRQRTQEKQGPNIIGGSSAGPGDISEASAKANSPIPAGDTAAIPGSSTSQVMYSHQIAASQNAGSSMAAGHSNYSDSDDESEASSKGSGDGQKYGKMDEKVLMRLGSIFPNAPR